MINAFLATRYADCHSSAYKCIYLQVVKSLIVSYFHQGFKRVTIYLADHCSVRRTQTDCDEKELVG